MVARAGARDGVEDQPQDLSVEGQVLISYDPWRSNSSRPFLGELEGCLGALVIETHRPHLVVGFAELGNADLGIEVFHLGFESRDLQLDPSCTCHCRHSFLFEMMMRRGGAASMSTRSPSWSGTCSSTACVRVTTNVPPTSGPSIFPVPSRDILTHLSKRRKAMSSLS